MKLKRADLIGRRYGNLVALRRLQPYITRGGHRISVWLCRCDCGTEKPVQYNALLRVVTCGRAECPYHVQRQMKGHMGAVGFSQVWRQYKMRAKKKGVPFTITRPEMVEMMARDCHYCGASPSNESLTPSFRGQFKYNGLDRVTPTRGYTLDNVRPCCWICNIMKGRLTPQMFFAHIRRILEYSQVVT